MPHLRLAIIAAALLVGAGAAHARPLRIVVLDFDGPSELSESARHAVVGLIANHDEVVPKRRWQTAFAHALATGKRRWRDASKMTGVDEVLEGTLTDQGGRYALTITVRDAESGTPV